MVDAQEEATIPRAQALAQSKWTIDDTGFEPDQLWAPPSAMIGAFYIGLLPSQPGLPTNNANLDITPSCPTGNCTFPPFQSLAVCSMCKNVTDLVSIQCSQHTPVPRLTFQNCLFKLPSGFAINQTYSNTSFDPEINLALRDLYHSTIAASALLMPPSPVEPNLTFTTTTILRGNSFVPSSGIESSKPNMTYEASQCSLSWCINTYEASVINGRVTETIVNSTWKASELNLKWDYSFNLSMTPPTTIPPGSDPHFIVNRNVAEGLMKWLVRRLTFSNSVAVDESGYLTPDASSDDYSAYPDDRTYAFSYEMRRLSETSDPSDVFSNVARALTSYIRSISPSEQEAADPATVTDFAVRNVRPGKGIARVLHVYIAIRWSWLAFTGAILISTLLFFSLRWLWHSLPTRG
jgi:hypothetical protein